MAPAIPAHLMKGEIRKVTKPEKLSTPEHRKTDTHTKPRKNTAMHADKEWRKVMAKKDGKKRNPEKKKSNTTKVQGKIFFLSKPKENKCKRKRRTNEKRSHGRSEEDKRLSLIRRCLTHCFLRRPGPTHNRTWREETGALLSQLPVASPPHQAGPEVHQENTGSVPLEKEAPELTDSGKTGDKSTARSHLKGPQP